MNNRENDDELERMRARARRGSGRQSSRAYPRPVQPAGERRSARQSYDGREEYDEEYYYGEEYDVEDDRQIDFPMEDYLDDEPPMPARRLRPSYGSSGSAEGRRQAQSAGIRGAPQKGSRIQWKGAGHLPDGSRDKWQNDVKKADGRGFFCSFWLHL